MPQPTRVLVVFGTRPEAIKLAPVITALRARPNQFDTVVAVTAQHRDMLDQVLAVFDIAPDHDLDIMRPQQSLVQITLRALEGLDPLLESVRPDIVLVQGDTTTTLVAALAAFYHRVPIGHVEAGLRTFDLTRPFPEEANRQLATRVCRWHFAPTETAAANLRREGISSADIHVTGNTVVDALLATAGKPYAFPPGAIADALSSGRRIVLVTAHRRENWGAPFDRICSALERVVRANRDVHVLFATHSNPAVAEPARAALGTLERLDLIGPLDYLPFTKLLQAATLIISDSGGIQEEAPAFGVPTLVLRDVTERPEAVEAGIVTLVGTDPDRIVAEADRLLREPDNRTQPTPRVNPFGDGRAAERIADVLAREGSRGSGPP